MLLDLRAFIELHAACGDLVGDATPATADGYLLWVECRCGKRFEVRVTEEMAADDLVFSPLLLSDN